jgi:hypothetical protein
MLEHAGRKDIRRLQEDIVHRMPCVQAQDLRIPRWHVDRVDLLEVRPLRIGHSCVQGVPHLFHDIVHRNRDYFLEKYAYYGRGIVRNPEPSGP